MAAQDDIDGSPPAQRRRLEEISVDPLTTVVSDGTRLDFLSGPRLAASDAGVMRMLLLESKEINAVLGRPCVMEKLQDDQYWGLEQEQQPLSEQCTITPLDATPFPAMIFCRPQPWVGANGDWLALLVHNGGGVQLHNVYTGMTVDVPPLSSTGLRQKNLWTFGYDLINPILKKIAIVRPPAKYRDFEVYDLIAVFDKRIAITGRCDVTNSLAWYMLATPHLTPWRYEDVVYSGGRYFAVTTSGDCYMWDPNDGGSMQPPISICAPQIVDEMVLQNGWHDWRKEWYLVPDGYGYLLIVRVAAEITGDEPEIPYLNRTIQSYNNASCDIFRIHAGQLDLRGAQWEVVPDLGEYSIFLGKSYPCMIEIKPQMMSTDYSMHARDDGMPFLKPGCVFIARHRISDRAAPSPDLCRFSLDGSAMLGCNLPSCYSGQETAPLWIVPSVQNFQDWNEHDPEVQA